MCIIRRVWNSVQTWLTAFVRRFILHLKVSRTHCLLTLMSWILAGCLTFSARTFCQFHVTVTLVLIGETRQLYVDKDQLVFVLENDVVRASSQRWRKTSDCDSARTFFVRVIKPWCLWKWTSALNNVLRWHVINTCIFCRLFQSRTACN